MKKRLLFMLTCLMTFSTLSLNAALPDGSLAEDFTLTDLNGVTYNLYDILEQGKPVILDFSATWCPPCWTYHNNGPLKDLWNTYGPNGTDEIQVFYVEADGSTNNACLYGPSGCVGGTMGDWVTGTPYPIFDLVGADLQVEVDYDITYFPTLYGVSPDKTTWEIGQASQGVWESWLLESFQLQATASSTNAFCEGEGSIDLTYSGGWNAVNVTWSNGMTGTSISGLNAGTYTATLTDAHGYSITTDPITVDGPISGQALGMNSPVVVDVDCNGSASGAIQVSATGGNFGYQYDWSNGDSGEFITGLSAGVYTLSITDANSCLFTSNIEVFEPEFFDAQAFPEDATCGEANGELFMIPYGGVAPYTYDIGNGPQSSEDFYDLAPGSYQITSVDRNNCVSTTTVEIEDVGTTTAAATATSEIDCANPETMVSGMGSSSGSDIAYQWSTTDGNIVSGADQLEAVVDMAGTYTIEVSNTTHGCVSMSSVVVTTSGGSAPVAMVEQPSELNCNVTQVIIDGSGSSTGSDFEYSWSTTDGNIVGGADGLTPTVNAPGSYLLEITNTTNGCVTTAMAEVGGDYNEPTVSVPASQELDCTTTSVELCATVEAGVTVEWNTPGGTVQGNCITVAEAGSFTAVATAPNGCSSEMTSSITASNDLPQIALQSTGEITCTVTEVAVEGTLDGELSEHTIEWTTADGNIVSGEGSLSIIVDAAGSYTMTASNNANGCTSSQTVVVDENILTPAASFEAEQMGQGVLSLSNNSNVTSGNILWDLGNGMTAEGNDITVEYEETGTYTICLTVENDCGTDQTCNDVMYISAMSVIASSSSITCNGAQDGTAAVEISGGLPNYTVVWMGDNGFMATDVNIADLAPGVYTVRVTDDAGNTIEETIDITEPSEITAGSNVLDISCWDSNDGEIELIDILGGTGEKSVVWNDGTAGTNLANLGEGSYAAVITDENGCTSTEEFELTAPDELVNDLVEIQNESGGDASGSITVDPQGGTGEITVEWNTGQQGTSLTGLSEGTYTATATDENGCSIDLGPFEVFNTTSLDELDIVSNFEMFPNPATTLVTINAELTSAKNGVLTLQNSVGQVILSERVGDFVNRTIDVTNFESGVYLVSIRTNIGAINKRLIVVK